MDTTSAEMYYSLGALYLGVTITMSLWGLGALQTYYYYNRYVSDTPWMRLSVFLVWTIDTVHQALIVHSGYIYLVINYMNPGFLNNVESTLSVTVVFALASILSVQLFLLFRIWKLSEKNVWLIALISILLILETIFSTMFFYQNFHIKIFSELEAQNWLIKLGSSMITIVDTLIALTLTVLLHRSKTGFKRSDNVINHLIVFTINTGAITSILSLLVTVMVQVYPRNLMFVAFYFCSSKIHVNTLLATLNSRDGIEEVTSSKSTLSRKSSNTRGLRTSTSISTAMAIRVETVTSHRIDDEILIIPKKNGSESKTASEVANLELGNPDSEI